MGSRSHRTRSTSNRSNCSRTTAFQRISTRFSVDEASPLEHPVARSRARATRLEITRTLLSPGKLFSASPYRRAFTRNWSTSCFKDMSATFNRSEIERRNICPRAAALLLSVCIMTGRSYSPTLIISVFDIP